AIADVAAGEEEPGELVIGALLDGEFEGLAILAAGGGAVFGLAHFGKGELVPVEAGLGVQGDGFALAVEGLRGGAEVGGAEAEEGPALGAAGVFAGELDELAHGGFDALLLEGIEGGDEV